MPSWATSTLSQLAVASVACYLVGAGWVLVKTGDLAPLKWAAEVFAVSYLTARKTGNGATSAPEKPTP